MLGHDPLSAAVTTEARTLFNGLFTRHDAEVVEMAVRAAGSEENPETIAASMIVLASDLLDIWP